MQMNTLHAWCTMPFHMHDPIPPRLPNKPEKLKVAETVKSLSVLVSMKSVEDFNEGLQN